LNAFEPGLRHAAFKTISSIAEQCDGIRRDMAMLMLEQHKAELEKQAAALKAQNEQLQLHEEQLAAHKAKIEAAAARFGDMDDYYILDEVTVYFGNGKVKVDPDC